MSKKLIIVFMLFLLAGLVFGQRYGESDDFSYALKLYNEGFFDIAAQQFSLFVNKYPESEQLPDAKYYLGLSLFNVKDYENARVEFQSMAVSFPDNKRAPEAWLKVGQSYEKLGKMEDAARAYETVKVLYPKDPNAPEALFNAAQIYFRIRAYDKAELVLQDFLDRYPESSNYPDGRLLYANLQMEKGNYDQAYKEFDKVLKSGANNDVQAKAYLGLGRFYFKLGQMSRAREQFETILSKYKTSSAAFDALIKNSELLALSRNYDSAIKLINANSGQFKSQKQKADIKLTLAAIYYFQEDYFSARKALEDVQSAALSDSVQARITFYLANIYQKEGKFDQSQTYFKNLLNDDKLKSAGAEYLSTAEKQLGYGYLEAGAIDQGYGALKEYVSAHPDDPALGTILSDLFQATIANGKERLAENVYQEILQKVPKYDYRDDLVFQLGKFYFRQKDYPKAAGYFQEVIDDYYCSAKYDSAKTYANIISNFFNVGQNLGVNKLARLMGRMLAGENAAQLQLELARIYLHDLKDFSEAIETGKKIIQTSTDSTTLGEAYHLLGESYLKLSRYKVFFHQDNSNENNLAHESLKKAMNFVNSIPDKDSLAFTFLQETVQNPGPENIPTDKKIQYWVHFKSSYPNSKFVERASFYLADLYQQTGQTKLALQQLEGPKNVQDRLLAGNAYYEMAKIYYEKNDIENAARVLKEFLLKIDEHPLRANAFGLLAKIRENEGNYEEAAQFWARLRKEYDYSPAAHAALNRIPEVYLMAGKNEAVIDYTKPFIQNHSSEDILLRQLNQAQEPVFYYYAGKAYYNMQKDDLARRELINYLYYTTDNTYNDEALFLLAELASASGDQDAALLHLQLIARNSASPFFVQALSKSADIYFERGDFENAQKYYSQLIANTSDTEQQIQFRANEMICLINQGQLKLFDSKVSQFKKDYRKNPDLDNFLASFEFEIGKYYYKNKNYNAAIKRFDTVAGKYKKTDYADDGEYYLGLTYATTNKVEKAQDILSKFAEKYPNSSLKANIFVTLGGLYYRAEKREMAVNAFQRGVAEAKDPETRKLALSNLIVVYRDLGLWDGALNEARTYVKEFPDAQDVMDKKIIIGSALINLNRFSEAVDYLRDLKFEANSDQEPEIQFYIGEAYFNSGQYESAIREFVKIPLLSKQTKLQWEASALYYSGQSYEKLGRRDDAIRMYQEIVDRPGILVDLKREAQKRISQLKDSG